MALNIRQGRPSEWQDILDVSHAAFGRGPTFFPRGWPHTYPDKTAAEWFVVCEEAGRILGVIDQTPVTVDVSGVRLPAVGIGGVGVLPTARFRGIMSAMLRASNAEQRAAGTIIGFLDGPRLRYRRFGFERAGQAVTATIPRKHLAEVEPVPLRRLRIADAADVLRLCRTAPLFVHRDRVWQERLLRRWWFTAWGNKTGPLRAYLVAARENPGHIHELIGPARMLPGLLRAHATRHKLKWIRSRWIPGYGPHLKLGQGADGLEAGPAQQIAIYDFGRFLERLAGPLGEGFRRAGITKPVRVRHAGEGTAFDLTSGRGALSVVPAKGRRKLALALDAAGWVRVSFPPPGGPMLKTEADPNLLAALALPLNFSGWEAV